MNMRFQWDEHFTQPVQDFATVCSHARETTHDGGDKTTKPRSCSGAETACRAQLCQSSFMFLGKNGFYIRGYNPDIMECTG
jgi:hypothetical protein